MKATKAVIAALKSRVIEIDGIIADYKAEKTELLDIIENNNTSVEVDSPAPATKPRKRRKTKKKYARRSPNREAVLAVLEDYDRLTPKEIIERCDVPQKSVYSALQGLKSLNKAYQNADKTWSAVNRTVPTRIHVGAQGVDIT